jgi:hypothetical protein
MLDFIKKAGVTFYLNVIAAVLTLVAAIIYIATNATRGYAVINGGMGIAFVIIALLLIVGGTYLSLKFGSQHFLKAIADVLAIVLICVAFGVLLSDRVGIASSLFTWDSHNANGWAAFYSSIVCLVFMLLAVLVIIVNAFFDNSKKVVKG